MKIGVLLISFGEPETATTEDVTPFLERIFLANAGLEGQQPDEAQRARSRELALARAPALVATYETIGGSPLNAQARAQSSALEQELGKRGHEARCFTAFQFLEPGVSEGARSARRDGCERLVVLPVYPLCGQSTTVAALESARRALESIGWEVPTREIAGWHQHPDYLPFRAAHAVAFLRDSGLDPSDPTTRLLFSVHGTPIRYLEAGNRYDRYVDEACHAIARGVGAPRYAVGFQNHTNRPIDWTQPAIEAVLDGVGESRVIVIAPSFMHEQSETLSELDYDLRARAEARGLAFHRVPVPHNDPRFVRILADLVEGATGATPVGQPVDWRRCICGGGKALCTNGMRVDTTDLPT